MLKNTISLLVLFLSITVVVEAQYIKYGKIITLPPTDNAREFIARDKVEFLPDLQLQASENHSYYAWIDEGLVLPVDTHSAMPDVGIRNLDYTRDIGSLVGAHSVNAAGGISYSIPLQCPMGSGGMSPQITIDYNSLGSSGILGKGWGLSAVSSITRANKTRYSTGLQPSPITMGSQDDFSIDGLRLINISGTNGLPDSEYRTEQESFCRIKAKGSGSVIEWFEVETKSGQTMIYKQQQTIGGGVLAWFLTEVKDVNGNYMTYSYRKNDSDYPYLGSISYTGNTNANILPYNHVVFYYDTSPFAFKFNVAGGQFTEDRLLREIRFLSEDSLVNRVYFEYNTSELLPRLTKIGRENVAGGKINETLFEWEPSNPTDISVSDFYNPQGVAQVVFPGDVNGDGITDLMAIDRKSDYSSSDKFKFYRSSNLNNNNVVYVGEESIGQFYSYEPPERTIIQKLLNLKGPAGTTKTTGVASSFSFDFNGDDILDQLKLNVDVNGVGTVYQYYHIYYGKYDGTNYSLERNPIFERQFGENHQLALADIDGNGKTDVVFFDPSNNEIFVLRSGSDFKFHILMTVRDYTPKGAVSLFPIDINGDGRMEIFEGPTINGNYIHQFDIDASNKITHSYFTVTNTPGIDWSAMQGDGALIEDFNGDGKTDILLASASSGNHFYLATGTGYNEVKSANGADPFNFLPYSHCKYLSGDFNGDGLADVMEIFRPLSGVDWSINIYSYNGDKFIRIISKTISLSQFDVKSPDVDIRDFTVGDFNGDGKADVLYKDKTSHAWRIIQIHRTTNPYDLIAIADGLNNTVEFCYENSLQFGNVPKSENLSFPFSSNNLALRIVSGITISDGTGSHTSIPCQFSDMVTHKQGKGFLGFLHTSQYENSNGSSVLTQTDYEANLTYAFLAPKSLRKYINQPINAFYEKSNTNTVIDYGGTRFLTYVSLEEENDYLTGLSRALLRHINSDGNITAETSVVDDVIKTITYNNYQAIGSWLPSKPQSITTSQRRGAEPQFRDTTTFIYYNNGLLKSQTEFSGKPKAATTELTYDNYGNNLSKTYSANGLVSRTSSVNFDPKGRAVVLKTNAVGHNTRIDMDFKWGVPKSITDPNGLVTRYEHDDWGRLRETHSPTGIVTSINYSWVQNKYPIVYSGTEITPGMPSSTSFYDQLARPIKAEGSSYNGDKIYSEKSFSSRGETDSFTNIYAQEQDKVITTRSYDVYGRLQSTVADGIGANTITYNGLQTTQNTPLFSKTTEALTNGNTKSVSDGIGTINYTKYNSRGQLREVVVGNKTVTIEYDDYGMQTKLTDPDAGTVENEYNAFGELIYQKDVSGNIAYDFVYDRLGRLTNKKEKDAKTNQVTEYQYVFDSAPNGKGKLAKVSINGHSNQYSYDSYSRLTEDREIINGTTFIRKYEYDRYGQVVKYTYPSGYAIIKNYNDKGFLSKIIQADNGTVLWELKQVNASGKITQRLSHNGNLITKYQYDTYGYLESSETKKGNQLLSKWEYTWDKPTGQLSSRKNKYGLHETFQYNNDRLTTVRDTVGNPTLTVTYDNSGASRIDTKSDAGTYGYDNTLGVNAVKVVKNYQPAIPELTQDITYNAFNSVSTITEGDYKLSINYGHQGERISSELYKNNQLLVSKKFVGDFEVETRGNITRKMHYVFCPDGLLGIEVKETNKPDKFYYTYQDYLGSVTDIVNESDSVVEEMSFDAWGRRRDARTWAYTVQPNQEWKGLIDRGYTGHEHLDVFGLINMNGRMYDPVLGLMLSPDNYVSDATSTLAFNRYLYANGNPLKYTDPNGEWAVYDDILAIVLGGTINLAANWGNLHGSFWQQFGQGAGYFLVGAAVGEAALYAAPYIAAITPFAAGTIGAAAFSGAVIGAGTGFLLGGSNTLIGGGNIGQALKNGGKGALYGAVSGAIAGGGSELFARTSWGRSVGAWYSSHSKGNYFNSKNPFSPRYKGADQAYDSYPDPEMASYNGTYQDESELVMQDKMYHYTNKDPVAEQWESIGPLDKPDNINYLTNNGELSKTGARSNLSLDKTPNFKIEISSDAMVDFDPSKVIVVRRVTGGVNKQGGGGWEVLYKGPLRFDKAKITVTRLP